MLAEYVLKARLRAERSLQLARNTDGAYPAGMHERNPVTQDVRFLHIMGGEQDCHRVLGPQTLDVFPHAVAGDRVQPDGRLVEDQQARCVDQRLSQLETTHHPARVGSRHPVGDLGQPHRGHGVVDPGPALAPRHIEQAREQRHVLPSGQPRVGREHLRHVADEATCSDRIAYRVHPEHVHRPGDRP